ncbi:hypothetical protein AX16_004343 [Volvariella volvacea WC 439]|nr:hypothetical protein AX16_004343 [Volvariella volvacea WC 439]
MSNNSGNQGTLAVTERLKRISLDLTQISNFTRELEKRDEENKALKQKAAEAKKTILAWEKYAAALNSEKKALEQQNRSLAKENARLQGELKLSKAEIGCLKADLQFLTTVRELEDERARDSWGITLTTQPAQLGIGRVEHRQERHESSQILGSQENTRYAPYMRGAEYVPPRPYTSLRMVNDGTPHSHIKTLMNSLNSSIIQTATRLAESFKFGRNPQRTTTSIMQGTELEVAKRRIERTLGQGLMMRLVSSGSKKDLILAIQVSMCTYSAWMLRPWSLPCDHRQAQLLVPDRASSRFSGLGDQLCTSTPSWRPAIFADTYNNSSTDAFYISGEIPGRPGALRKSALDIIIAAGFLSSSFDVQDDTSNRLSEDINAVLQNAQQLKQVLGQQVTSCNLKVTHILPGEKYKSFKVALDGTGSGEVIGTAELGLLGSERKGSQVEERVILKPKVVSR